MRTPAEVRFVVGGLYEGQGLGSLARCVFQALLDTPGIVDPVVSADKVNRELSISFEVREPTDD